MHRFRIARLCDLAEECVETCDEYVQSKLLFAPCCCLLAPRPSFVRGHGSPSLKCCREFSFAWCQLSAAFLSDITRDTGHCRDAGKARAKILQELRGQGCGEERIGAQQVQADIGCCHEVINSFVADRTQELQFRERLLLELRLKVRPVAAIAGEYKTHRCAAR